MTTLAMNMTSISSLRNEERNDTYIEISKDVLDGSKCVVVCNTDSLWGPTLLGSLFTFSFVSLVMFIYTIFNNLPYITPKFAIFMTMLFGGLALEVLWAKKMAKDERGC